MILKAITVLIPLLVIFGGCASAPQNKISFEKTRALEVGRSTVSDFELIFGAKVERTDKEGYYTLNYFESASGLQRVSANFDAKTNILVSYLWIPGEGEKELSLSGAKDLFRKLILEPESDKDKSHFISKVITYADKKSGVSIRYNESNDIVEAIAVYEPKNRVPTATK